MVANANAILQSHLASCSGLVSLVGDRIYCPRLPENCTLPAVGFFVRGGTSSPYIPPLPSPSVQIDCWATSPVVARQVYRAVYDALQGIENQTVWIGIEKCSLVSAIEEGQAQDLQDSIPGYYRVLASFRIIIRGGE